jgi:hypothetical protein
MRGTIDGLGGERGATRGDDTTRRLVAGPPRREAASRGDGSNRGLVRNVGSTGARRFHQRPAFAAVVDFWGALLTAVALAGALLGSGCGATGSACSAWNTGRAAACAVCALPDCGTSEVGAGGDVLVDPACVVEVEEP